MMENKNPVLKAKTKCNEAYLHLFLVHYLEKYKAASGVP